MDLILELQKLRKSIKLVRTQFHVKIWKVEINRIYTSYQAVNQDFVIFLSNFGFQLLIHQSSFCDFLIIRYKNGLAQALFVPNS